MAINFPECFICMGNVCACQDGLLTSFEQPSAHSGLPCRSVHSLIITFCMIEVVKLVQIEEGGKRKKAECEAWGNTFTYTVLQKHTRMQTSDLSVHRKFGKQQHYGGDLFPHFWM